MCSDSPLEGLLYSEHNFTHLTSLLPVQIVYGTLSQLLEVDFGAPLHCLVICGETHPLEQEVSKLSLYFCVLLCHIVHFV